MLNKYLAEFFGTFILVFAGTAAIVVNDLTQGMISHAGIAMVFGLTVMVIIYAFGDISGAHINPAVTVAFWLARRFPGRQVVPYMAAQILGAISSSISVYFLFGDAASLGATHPAGTHAQSFVLEIVLSFILMLVIMNVATGAKETGMMAGIAIGGIVGVEALFAGPISGASMNPARSLGPALISGELQSIWIYIIGPLVGTSAAILNCRWIRTHDCCT